MTAMEVVILIGIPASGKSTFYKQRFVDTHVRINRDMLNTRNRERKLFDFCLSTEQRCVIDNTNVSVTERRLFIEPAVRGNVSVIGYYFQSASEECYARNQAREGDGRVPDVAIFSKLKDLELPSMDEGFTKLHYVKLGNEIGSFDISAWDESAV